MEALNRWLAAQSNLEKAASEFFDTCVALRAGVSHVLSSHANHAILEDLLHQVQSRIDMIGLSEKHMRDSRSVLNSLLNTSARRVPAIKLPPETLSRIFTLAAYASPCCCDYYNDSTLRSISLVCVRWHEVAINVPSLWSHIGIRPRNHTASDITLVLHRVQLWLNRSRGTSIHIHLSEGFGKGTQQQSDFSSKLVTILQPHVSYLRSLKVSGAESPRTFQSLLSLHSIHGTSGSLKTLSVSGIRATDRGDIFNWPTSSLGGLVELDLADLGKFACPSSDVIAAMLCNSPTLHTLRLRDLKIRLGPRQVHPAGHLPCLKLLEITGVSGDGLSLLILAIAPGVLELDARLDLDNDGLDPYFEALLVRSNVTSLSLHNISHRRSELLRSYLCCTPNLRALLLKFTPLPNDSWAPGELLTGYDLGSRLPHLQSLCLMHGEISRWFMENLKVVVIVKSLRKLVFLSCRFSLSLGGLPENQDGVDDDGNDHTNSNDGDNDNDDSSDDENGDGSDGSNNGDDNDESDDDWHEEYDKEMPECIKEWLSDTVENVFVFSDRFGQVCKGVDPFVQMLTGPD